MVASLGPGVYHFYFLYTPSHHSVVRIRDGNDALHGGACKILARDLRWLFPSGGWTLLFLKFFCRISASKLRLFIFVFDFGW